VGADSWFLALASSMDAEAADSARGFRAPPFSDRG